MKIKDILINKKENKVKIKGWVISNRGNEKIRFINVNDGSSFENIQTVLKSKEAKKFDSLKVGSSVEVDGKIKLTPKSKQPLELEVQKFTILRQVEDDYPLQKQGMSMEILRNIPHMRHRTNTFRAVMRIRSTIALLIHDFFNSKNFLWHSSPIITSNDGEGAGESFVIDSEEGDFFKTRATLGVTGQLHAEAYSTGFGDVYTFGPTFRAEKSHTQRHAAEFWMLEPEMAFANKEDIIQLSDDLLKYVIKGVIKKHNKELKFLNDHIDNKLKQKLENYLSSEIKTISYSDVLEILKKNKSKFKVQDIKFGIDLGTEHERFIAEKIYNGPVAVVDFPKSIKAFYMKLNDDGKTVGAFDVLVPGIGELIGGSERETDISKLEMRLKELGIEKEPLNWYLDLRRYGMFQSVGFGLGFERLVMYITGMSNIRDVIAFPRSVGNLKM